MAFSAIRDASSVDHRGAEDANDAGLQADLDIRVVSLEDVYGGKLAAAMDRQHPRDLFDVMQLFAHEGIAAGIRRAFVIYLASHIGYDPTEGL
jgi:predicted nucleotidyltransferase component of viral defense system